MKKRKVLLIIGVVIIIVIAVGYYLNNKNDVQVKAYKVKKTNIEKSIEETAVIKSHNQKKIYAKGTGEIIKLNKGIGDIVEEGDVIAQISTEDLNNSIKILESKLSVLQASYAEALKLPRKELIENAEANIKTIEIRLEEGKRNAESSKKLFEEGAISEEVYQKTLDNVETFEESLIIAKNELKLLKEGPSENIKKEYEANISQIQYQIEQLINQKQDYVIKAPFKGIVLEKYVEEGVFTQKGMAVIEIGRTDDLYIEFDVLAGEMKGIKSDTKLIVYSEDLGITDLNGKVNKVYPKAFSKVSDLGVEQKKVRIEGEIIGSITDLRIGYEVDVRIITDKKEGIITVPESAVVDIDEEKHVYIIENNIINQRKIEIGLEGDDNIEVLSGLEEGKIIVLDPSDDIDEGINVVVVE